MLQEAQGTFTAGRSLAVVTPSFHFSPVIYFTGHGKLMRRDRPAGQLAPPRFRFIVRGRSDLIRT